MQLWLPVVVAAGYLLCAALFFRVYREKLHPLFALGVLVLVCQGHALVLIRSVRAGEALNLSVFNVVSIYAWAIAVVAFFGLWRRAEALPGVLIALINALCVLLPVFFVSEKPFLAALSAGMKLHILLSVAAWSVLSLAFVHALLYAWVFQSLKRKRLAGGAPIALVGIERVMMVMTAIGAALLSASLLSGWMYVEDLFAQHLWHKTVLTMLSWLVLLWTLFVWLVRRERGMRLAYRLMMAYALLLAGYVLSNVVLQFVIR
ncbi:MAG: cytochrome c biogenesis protein CcsA [Cardiobacteriaceae bacterium]|nr:cytochrome c biogenesis protein CcsA [Cardiobacteriaceae bacterium]